MDAPSNLPAPPVVPHTNGTDPNQVTFYPTQQNSDVIRNQPQNTNERILKGMYDPLQTSPPPPYDQVLEQEEVERRGMQKRKSGKGGGGSRENLGVAETNRCGHGQWTDLNSTSDVVVVTQPVMFQPVVQETPVASQDQGCCYNCCCFCVDLGAESAGAAVVHANPGCKCCDCDDCDCCDCDHCCECDDHCCDCDDCDCGDCDLDCDFS